METSLKSYNICALILVLLYGIDIRIKGIKLSFNNWKDNH